MLERLGAGSATISELAEPFGMSLTGMKKHIRLLEEAELVTTEKIGRARRCTLVPYAFEASARGSSGSTASHTLSNERKEHHEHYRHDPERARDPRRAALRRTTRTCTPSGRIRRSSPTGGATAPSSRRWTSASGGTWRFRTAYGVVEGEYREVEPPERLVQTFQNHLQTLEFEDLGEQTKLVQTMRFETTEERDTTMNYGVEEGREAGLRAHRRRPREDHRLTYRSDETGWDRPTPSRSWDDRGA